MSPREREIKLAVSSEYELPTLSDEAEGISEDPSEMIGLDATYYDTRDLRLTRGGASLRRRNDEGWTVKLPADDADDDEALSRDEHHFPDDPIGPPEAAVDLVRALVRTGILEPVAEIHTDRRRVPVRGPDGRVIAEVVDDHVHVTEGASLEKSFREIEIELAEHISDAQRSALLSRLATGVAGVVDPTPKIVRALGPAASAPPDVEVPAIGPGARVEEVVRASIASGVAKIIHHDPGVRLGEQPEEVHQMRVATRRLRSHLKTFKELIDEQWATELRDELRWVGDVLGAVRDAEVLLDRLEHKVARIPSVDRPAAEKLLDTLRADLDRRRTQLIEGLRSDRYLSLLDRLVRAARQPRVLLRVHDKSDDEVLRGLVRGPWRKLEETVGALDEVPSDPSLHEIRILTKRVRYAAEAVAPAFGKPARVFARAMVEIQDVLGEHQDAVIASEWLRSTAGRTEDEAQGFAAGQLAGIEHFDSLAARAEWPKVWKRASRRKLRDWL